MRNVEVAESEKILLGIIVAMFPSTKSKILL